MLMGMVEGTAPTVVVSTGGGGSASISPLFAVAVDNGFSGTYTSSTITFSAGYVALSIWINFGGPIASSAVALNGVTATLLTSTVGSMQGFGATVSSGNGTFTINTGVLGTFSAAAWTLTGLSSTTPTAISGYTTNQLDPQGPVSLTVNSGGVGTVAMGRTFDGRTGMFPVTWTQATRDSILEASVNTGNTAAIAGARESSAGTYSITSSGSSQGWDTCNILAMAFA